MFLIFLNSFSTSERLDLFLVTLLLIFLNLVSKSVFFTKLLTLDILPSILVTLVLKSVFFLTKLVTSGIFFVYLIDFIFKICPTFFVLGP